MLRHHPRVGDDAVDAAERFDRLRHRRDHARLVADVDLLREHAATELAQLRRGLGVLLGPPAPDDDVAAGAGDAAGEPEADPGVAARDHDHPAGQVEHGCIAIAKSSLPQVSAVGHPAPALPGGDGRRPHHASTELEHLVDRDRMLGTGHAQREEDTTDGVEDRGGDRLVEDLVGGRRGRRSAAAIPGAPAARRQGVARRPAPRGSSRRCADRVGHLRAAQRAHGNAEPACRMSVSTRRYDSAASPSSDGASEPFVHRGVVGPRHEHGADRREQRRAVTRVADAGGERLGPTPREEDHVAAGDRGEPHLAIELRGEQLGLLDRRRRSHGAVRARRTPSPPARVPACTCGARGLGSRSRGR